MEQFTKTTEGMVKAAVQIAQQNQVKPPNYPRYAYRDAGFGIHARRLLKPLERAKLELELLSLRLTAAGSPEREEVFKAVMALPVKRVNVKYAEIQDHSKYPVERLRAIRQDGGGKKEQARAAKRRAAMSLGDGGTVFSEDVSYTPALAEAA